jgi:DNA-binding phage protein
MGYATRQANEAKAVFIDNLKALLNGLGKTNKAICLEAELSKDELFRATKPDTVARLITIFKLAQMLNMDIILTPKKQKDETSQI